ncbi:hypothetical protein N7462_006474 [Penicillium macrosclerotiorum]|uniref:uncharacterized protein n=1 Tax=Penicillium macrosclerotiorum TaxID=303699 RepID=UPI0025493698|nr:uncharacterized protein N7462_006474 [Penicillium macrosclerotiorum]KAJ5683309.1 hypothetical protein N7462_006474 [Penicillium macrosclerotiorum]
MDIFAATSSICKNVEDYSIISQKGDMLIDEVSVYAMRDTIQWWTHWHGSLKDHCWKHIYTAFSTVVEDISIPPHHLMNGQFRLLGNSLADLLEGLRKEGVGPQNVAFMEMCLLRQYLVQYYVKQDQELRDKLCIHSAFAENWRHILTNTYGVTMSVLMAKQTEATGLADIAVKITPIVDAISMDLIKGESAASPDFAVAFEDNRHYPRHDLLEVYTRYMTLLGLHPSAPLLSRSVSSGLHFVPMMDGARERIKHVRFPMSVSLRHMIESYVKA